MSYLNYLNDEPAEKDMLGREEIAKAFGNYIQDCKTPFVIGLYGSWGAGKTTLMRLIEKELPKEPRMLPIRFDAWQYQNAEDIEVVLLQKTFDAFKDVYEKQKKKEIPPETQQLFAKAFNSFKAFTSAVSKVTYTTPIMSVELEPSKSLEEHFDIFESEKAKREFNRIQEICLIRDGFESFIFKIKEEINIQNLVFFIDDLDRCSSKNSVRILEIIKNYLNVESCVYVIGVDKEALEKQLRNEGIRTNEKFEYLDKIIQLPFQIPLINNKQLENFISKIFENELPQEYIDILLKGLGDNPRYIKRFFNTLNLGRHLIMSQEIRDESKGKIEKNLILILLINYLSPDLHKTYSINNKLLRSHINILKKGKDASEKEQNQIDQVNITRKLKEVFKLFPTSDFLQEDEDYEIYFNYSRSTEKSGIQHIEDTQSLEEIEDVKSKLEAHRKWLLHGEQDSRLDLAGYHLYGFDFPKNADLSGSNFREAWLNNANFEGVIFNKLEGREATDFCKVDLAFGNIEDANFGEIDSWYSNFYRVNAVRVRFTGTDLGGSSFKEAKLIQAKFEKTKGLEAEFNDADLTDAKFVGNGDFDVDLYKANFENATLVNTEFRQAKLGLAKFNGANLNNAKFIDSDLREANFEGAELINASFENADITFAKFNNSNVAGVDFKSLRGLTGGTIYQAHNIQDAKFRENFWREVVNRTIDDGEYSNVMKKLKELNDKYPNILLKEPFCLREDDVQRVYG